MLFGRAPCVICDSLDARGIFTDELLVPAICECIAVHGSRVFGIAAQAHVSLNDEASSRVVAIRSDGADEPSVWPVRTMIPR